MFCWLYCTYCQSVPSCIFLDNDPQVLGGVYCLQQGTGIAQWLECLTHDWKVMNSSPCRSSRRIFFSMVSFLCWLLFWYPFHPRVTAVACRRSQSFCQKGRWQVTDKHTCTLCMWFCMNWHGAWLYGVHRMHREGSSFTWHQPCQCCKYTTSVDIQNHATKTSHSCIITCEHSESAWEWRIALFKKTINSWCLWSVGYDFVVAGHREWVCSLWVCSLMLLALVLLSTVLSANNCPVRQVINVSEEQTRVKHWSLRYSWLHVSVFRLGSYYYNSLAAILQEARNPSTGLSSNMFLSIPFLYALCSSFGMAWLYVLLIMTMSENQNTPVA